MGRQFGTAAPAREHVACIAQVFKGGFVGSGALRLEQDGLVGLEAECGERRQYALGRAGNLPLRIDVFHAQQPLPTVVAGDQPATDGSHQRPEVQGAGGRGREASPVAHAVWPGIG